MKEMQLKDKIRNLSKIINVNFNIILRVYMYDRFIERLAVSKYRDNFILKGGFYLSSFIGVQKRSTLDIDTAIKNMKLDEDNITKAIETIINIDIGDDAKISLNKIEKIKENDEYEGYKVFLEVHVGKIKENFHVDIATGDVITPKEIEYTYNCVLENKAIKILAYNKETIIAEKIESILSKSEANSRMKDYFDIYLICSLHLNELNEKHLASAIANTFKQRNFKGNIIEEFETIKNSKILNNKWINFSKNNNYAYKIAYDDIIESVENIIKICEKDLCHN